MNKKEIKLLKITYKKESDAKIRERILMNIYVLQGENVREIAERLNCTHPLVIFWKHRYEKEGLEGLKTRQKSGKPMLLSRRQEAKIKNKISENDPANPWTTKRVCELIKKESGIKYSPRNVRRMLHKWRFALLVPRPTFWQRASGDEIRRFWKKNPLPQEKIFEPYSVLRR
jgi:transposase